MTSFHLRLDKKGGSRRARPSSRRQRALRSRWLRLHRLHLLHLLHLLIAALGTKSGRRPGRAPPSTGPPHLCLSTGAPLEACLSVPPALAREPTAPAASTCEGRLRPTGLLTRFLNGPLPPIVTALLASGQLTRSLVPRPPHPRTRAPTEAVSRRFLLPSTITRAAPGNDGCTPKADSVS